MARRRPRPRRAAGTPTPAGDRGPARLAERTTPVAQTATINIAFFNGAGAEWTGPAVRVTLRDPFTNSPRKVLLDRETSPGTSFYMIEGVPADAGQRYILTVDAEGHRSHSVFPVKVRPNAVTRPFRMMLVRNDPEPDFSGFDLSRLRAVSPEFHAALEGIKDEVFALPQSDTQFGRARLAALLNIEAKLRATPLGGGHAASYVSLVEKIECCEPDRVKAFVKPEMPARVAESGRFKQLNTAANRLNHPEHPVGYKEKVDIGSLQLSFAEQPTARGLAADMDIDLYTGAGHVGEVIKNDITDTKTDPFAVYAQLFDQGISPLYSLKV